MVTMLSYDQAPAVVVEQAARLKVPTVTAIGTVTAYDAAAAAYTVETVCIHCGATIRHSLSLAEVAMLAIGERTSQLVHPLWWQCFGSFAQDQRDDELLNSECAVCQIPF